MLHKHNQEDKAIVGVYLGGKVLMAGKVKNSQIEKQVTKTINNLEAEEVILKEVITAIEEVFDDEVVGIGIGAPSLIDVEQGIVFKVHSIPSWREVHLGNIIEGRFGVKTYINNDANCFVVGEKYFGTAQQYNNIVGLIIGSGFGAGIIFNGHLFSGHNCGAGEFGSIPYRDHDYEYYCSASYFDEKYGIKAEVLLERAESRDKIALAIFEQFGFDLGNAIKTVMYSVDPEVIVIGGPLSKAFPYFEKAMWKNVRSFIYEHAQKKLKILASEQPNIAVLGAAALYYDAKNKIY